MANFSNGVSEFIEAEATIKVWFPVDFLGKADVSCNQCKFYRRNSKSCALNGAVCSYPEKYIGVKCPLEFKEEKQK